MMMKQQNFLKSAAARDLSLAQIALQTGFSEQSHFTRVFRSVIGTSPGAWQRHRRTQ